VSNLNFVIDSLTSDENTLVASVRKTDPSQKTLMQILSDEAEQFNQTLPKQLQASKNEVALLIRREQDNGHPVAMRAVGQYFNTLENPDTLTPTEHRDLLPKGHPLSTRWVSSFKIRREVAQFFTTDKRIPEGEIRTLVASALVYEPGSAQRMFYEEVITLKTRSLPILAIIERADILIEERKKRIND